MIGTKRARASEPTSVVTRAHDISLGPNWHELKVRRPTTEEILWFIKEGGPGHKRQRELEEKGNLGKGQIYRWIQLHK